MLHYSKSGSEQTKYVPKITCNVDFTQFKWIELIMEMESKLILSSSHLVLIRHALQFGAALAFKCRRRRHSVRLDMYLALSAIVRNVNLRFEYIYLTNDDDNGHFDGFDFGPRYDSPRAGSSAIAVEAFVLV